MTAFRLFPGMIIRTNYSGPYQVASVERDCTCPDWDVDTLKEVERLPHAHVLCRRPGDSDDGPYCLTVVDEESLRLDTGNDRIEIIDSSGAQFTLF